MKRTALLCIAALLTACAVAPRQDSYSLVDPKGVDPQRYAQDYSECQSLADQTSVGGNAAAGAGAGAIIGGIFGALLCGRNCATQGAAFGAGYGGTGAAIGGVREQQGALRACLANRGYAILR